MRILSIAFIVGLAALAAAEIPDIIKTCGRQNPKLNECVQSEAERLRPNLREGIKQLDVPPIEPISLEKITLANTSDFSSFAKNVKVHGLSEFEILSLNVDLKTFVIDVNLLVKKLNLNADVDFSGRIGIPIAGKGPIKINTDEVRANASLVAHLVNHKGAKYLVFKSMTLALDIKDYTSTLIAQDGEDGPLTKSLNQLFAENKGLFLRPILPNMEAAISEAILNVANQICKHFTYDELFPDRE